MRRRLNTLAREFEKGNSSFDPGVVLKQPPGWVRARRGNANTVLVLEDGFEYEGQRYCSLSMIAERITRQQRRLVLGRNRAPRRR